MSIQKTVEREIEKKPYIMETLADGLINRRSLSRFLAPTVRRTEKSATIEAIAMAIGRAKVTKRRFGVEGLLHKAKVRVRSGVVDFTVEPSESAAKMAAKFDVLHLMKGPHGITIIVDEEKAGALRNAMKGMIIREREGVAEIAITTPPAVERTVGWVAFVTGTLAREGINLVEIMSCFTDTVLIVEEKDVAKVMDVFQEWKN